MMNNVIDIRELVVVRGGHEVLPGISLAVAAGVTGLLGPSGCGKSTLLRAVVGVQRVRSGGVEVLGLPAGDRRLRDRVGYVTQAASVYDDLTVAENLHFFARVLGVDRAEVDEAIAAVDLADRRDHVVGNLSGGQRSRASLAVALLGDPDVLVLDEPTVGLDPVLAPGPVAALPPARGQRQGRARLEPRDGRGGPVRPAAADARGPHHRRRHARRDPRRGA